MRYDQFLLEIDKDNNIKAVHTAPNGGASNRGPYPLGVTDLEHEYIRAFVDRLRANKLGETELELLGKTLFKAIFPRDIADCFEQIARAVSNDYWSGQKDRLLRLHITVDEGSDVARWPLEYLYNESITWLATCDFITLSRRLEYNMDYEPPSHDPPLKVLVVISKPQNLGGVLSAKVVEQISRLGSEETSGVAGAPSARSSSLATTRRSASRQPSTNVTVLGMIDASERADGVTYLNKPATFVELKMLLQKTPMPDVLHFIGHGQIDQENQKGQVVFVKKDGTADPVSGDVLGNLFPNPNKELRLVVLQACESASATTGHGFMSVAASLLRRNIPAVVAMQFDIRNEYASMFASDFYESLAQGAEVDTAVQKGRVRISNEDTRWSVRDFGTPVLFILKPSGIIIPVGVVAQPASEPKVMSPPKPEPTLRMAPAGNELAINNLTNAAMEATKAGDYGKASELLKSAKVLQSGSAGSTDAS